MENAKPKLTYFDGSKTHVGKQLCCHCKFFSGKNKAWWKKEVTGHCVRCNDCYPQACFCMGSNVGLTDNCNHWVERSDAALITSEDTLPTKCELEWDDKHNCKV